MSIRLELVEGEQRWFLPRGLGPHGLLVSPSHELDRFGVIGGMHHVVHHLGTVAAFKDRSRRNRGIAQFVTDLNPCL
jgi:hypothetical protein